ncbi:hypothetical protein EIP91_011354, partial [Steccherinum ochraceum]
MAGLLQENLVVDGVRVRASAWVNCSVVCSLPVYFERVMCASTAEPRSYLNFDANGALQRTQTLDGVPYKKYKPVLRLLAASMPGPVTLQFTTRGATLNHIWFSHRRFLLASIALDLPFDSPSLGYVICCPKASCLALYISPDDVLRVLSRSGRDYRLRDVSAEYAAALDARVGELLQALASGSPTEHT